MFRQISLGKCRQFEKLLIISKICRCGDEISPSVVTSVLWAPWWEGGGVFRTLTDLVTRFTVHLHWDFLVRDS